MTYTNDCLNKRISRLTETIHNTFKDKDQVRKYIEQDLETGSNIIQRISDTLKNIAEKNQEIYFAYKKMKEKMEEEMKNLIGENDD